MANNPRAADNLKPIGSSERAAALGALGGKAKKGKRHINTWIQEILEDEEFETTILDAKNGITEYKGAPLKAIIKAQTHLALHSKEESIRIKATDLLMKHGWPAKSETDVTSLGEQVSQPVDANMLTQFLQQVTENTKR